VDQVEQRGRAVPVPPPVGQVLVPPRIAAGERARGLRRPPAVDLRGRPAHLGRPDLAHPARVGHVRPECGPPPGDLALAVLGGDPVAEPAVDRAFAGGEQGDGEAVRDEPAVLLGQERPQDAAPPVRDRHRHPRDPFGRERGAAGERHVERERPGDPDDLTPVLGDEVATRVEQRPDLLQVLLGVVEAEGAPVRLGDGREVGGGRPPEGDRRGEGGRRVCVQHEIAVCCARPSASTAFAQVRASTSS
jgi:hypothetical protein